MQNNKPLRFRNISWKLTLYYAAIFSVILLALSFGILYGMRYFLLQEAYRTVQGSTAATRDAVLDAIKGGKALTGPELLNEAVANPSVEIVIADAQGGVISQSADTGLPVTESPGVIREIHEGDSHIIVQNSLVATGGQTQAYVQIRLDFMLQDSFLRVAQIAIGIADIAGILLSLLAGNLAAKRMLRPIDNMTKTAREISITDLNRRIDEGDGNDEITRLAGTFNDMIARLRVSFERQNAFVSDASHELRTPIAVIRGYIDMIDRWGKNDPSILNEAIGAIQNETHNMEDLVEKLLFLARNDTGRLNVAKEVFDLPELADEVTTEYGLIAPGREVVAKIPAGMQLCADRRLIKQALRALVDNGIKFSPEGGTIRIRAAEEGLETAITVEDRGIGIAPEKIGSIFERFYRVDSARERKTGGVGLGLSIVQTIVLAHRGRISVKSQPGQGTAVTILLPVPPVK